MKENKTLLEQNVQQVTQIIEKLKNREINFYFFTLDTKGNPTAGIANIYEHVYELTNLGFNAHILHEKLDYKRYGDEDGNGIADWLGKKYADLSHISIEGADLNISPNDFIIIPEIFSNVMDQVKNFPCKKIVFSQNYDYLLELLPIGKSWLDFGFYDVITTTKKQANYLQTLFPGIKTHIIPVAIADYFKESDKPKNPTVAILTRNSGDAAKIAKQFYLQYPIYRWVTFKEFRGMSRETFAKELSTCCLAVWVDQQSSFGTFPLESIECGTAVIGVIPNMIPEWMEEHTENGIMMNENGMWISSPNDISELIATYLKLWLEDGVPDGLIDAMNKTKGSYTKEKRDVILKDVYETILQNRISEFEIMLENFKTELKEYE